MIDQNVRASQAVVQRDNSGTHRLTKLDALFSRLLPSTERLKAGHQPLPNALPPKFGLLVPDPFSGPFKAGCFLEALLTQIGTNNPATTSRAPVPLAERPTGRFRQNPENAWIFGLGRSIIRGLDS